MSKQYTIHLILVLSALVGFGPIASALDEQTSRATFDKQVKPLLDRYCVSCHGEKKQKADFRMDNLSPDMVNGGHGDWWHEVANQLNQGDMPPDDEDQPTAAERKILVSWLADETQRATHVLRSTGGRTVMRRMTKYEYNNTLRDLLGIEGDFAKALPPEAAAKEGFVNNSGSLQTSAMHLQYFREIARSALRQVLTVDGSEQASIVKVVQPESDPVYPTKKKKPSANALKRKKPPVPRVQAVKLDRRTMNGIKKSERRIVPFTTYRKWHTTPHAEGVVLRSAPGQRQQRFHDVDRTLVPSASEIRLYTRMFPFSGRSRITIRAAATDPEAKQPAVLQIVLGTGKKQRLLADLPIRSPDLQDYIFDFNVEDYPLEAYWLHTQIVYINNVFDFGTSPLNVGQTPGILVDSIRLEAPFAPASITEAGRRILFDSPNKGNESTYLAEVLQAFMTRAYRRPALADDLAWATTLYQEIRSKGLSEEDALIETLAAVLSSPDFLLLLEPAPINADTETLRQLNNYEIATRLSYFLWNSMPDDRLFKLSESGVLNQESVLIEETNRMLQDPRSDAFFANFTDQWLGIDDIYNVAVNPEHFEGFNDRMKDVMKAETIGFFKEIVQEDHRMTRLIDADFAMLNGDLARYYGIPNISGNFLRPVALPANSQRGGLLTQAGLLTRNSNGDDSHPVKRGVWLLERLLNDPPPPAPAAVAAIEEAAKDLPRKATLKQKLERHREEESCMVCHRLIDPWGIAFEQYDGIGKIRAEAVETKTTLSDGTSIAGLDALKAHLVTKKKDQFTETLSRRMLAFALGRYLDFRDTEAVEGIHDAFKKNGYQGKALIQAVVTSEPFLTK